MRITGGKLMNTLADWLTPYEEEPVAAPDADRMQPKARVSTFTEPVLRVKEFVLARASNAVPAAHTGPRVSEQGYDKDDPNAALDTYFKLHPDMKKHGYRGSHLLEPNVMLSVVRQSVDLFPELNITVSREVWNAMPSEAQEEWSMHYDTMRAAQQQWILDRMDEKYPGLINKNPPTILYSGGQAKGYLRVFFVSANEYGAFYWSNNPITGTDSGAYRAGVWDFITHGRNRNEQARFDTRAGYEDTPAGEYTFLGPGDRKIWTYDVPTGMVDYSRGNIPSMLWPAVVTHLTVSPNLREVGKLVGGQAQAVAKEYWRRLGHPQKVHATEQSPVSDAEVAAARAYFKDTVAQAQAHRASVMAKYPGLES